MEALQQDLSYLVAMLEGEFVDLKEDYPKFLKLVVDLAILVYTLIFSLKQKNVISDEELEKALIKAQSLFDELRLKFGHTSGTA
jgi:hypothetical protein